MKLEGDLKLRITRIEDATDSEGCLFLKCKGYNSYRAVTPKGRQIKAYNAFSTIRLYPINQEQYEETKRRLFEQTKERPTLKVVGYVNELTTNIIGGVVRPILVVSKYDFETEKLFKKNKLLRARD